MNGIANEMGDCAPSTFVPATVRPGTPTEKICAALSRDGETLADVKGLVEIEDLHKKSAKKLIILGFNVFHIYHCFRWQL